MATTKPNPLAAFASTAPQAFRLVPPPNIHEHVQRSGLMDGLKNFQAAIQKQHEANERLIMQQFSQLASKLPKGGT